MMPHRYRRLPDWFGWDGSRVEALNPDLLLRSPADLVSLLKEPA